MKKFGKIFMIFCVLFSQLGGALDVFAEEFVPNEENSYAFDVCADGKIIDGDSYTVTDTKTDTNSVAFTLKNGDGDTDISDFSVNGDTYNGSYSVSYSEKLLGSYTYSYTFETTIGEESLSRKINVTYNYTDESTTNDEILNNLVSSDNIVFSNGNVYVIGNVTVSDFLDYFSILKDDGYILSVEESSEDGEENVDDDENEDDEEKEDIKYLSSNMSFKIVKDSDSFSLTYNVTIIGDVNYDGEVNYDDVSDMVDAILNGEDYYDVSADVNGDNSVNIFDVTKLNDAIKNGWDNTVNVNDAELSLKMDSDSYEYQIGEKIIVNFSLNNFESTTNDGIVSSNSINGLSGKIVYNNQILDLKSVSVASGMTISYNDDEDSNDDGEFIIYGSDYNSEDALITCVFTAKSASDEAIVSISNLVAAFSGEKISLSNSVISKSFKITYSSNKGGDYEEAQEETVTTLVSNTVSKVSKVLSSDSYLSDLSVEGYEFDFSPYTFKYEITVGSDVTSLNINAILSDINATYTIYGNEDFQEGENIVTIVVTAEDGTTHTYTLVVNKEKAEKVSNDSKKDSSTEVSESSTSKTIIVILIILVIIGLIYLIFKDDEEDEEKIDKKNK